MKAMDEEYKEEGIAWTVVKIRARFGRGQGWLWYVKDLILLFLGLYVVEDVFERFGFDSVFSSVSKYLYIVVPVGYFVIAYYIGYMDEKKGIWLKEAIYSTKYLNPFMKKLDAKVNKLLEEMEALNRKK